MSLGSRLDPPLRASQGQSLFHQEPILIAAAAVGQLMAGVTSAFDSNNKLPLPVKVPYSHSNEKFKRKSNLRLTKPLAHPTTCYLSLSLAARTPIPFGAKVRHVLERAGVFRLRCAGIIL